MANDTPADEAPEAVAIDVSGDHLNARRFLEEHGDYVRWAPQLGRWFEWSGAWWMEDCTEHVLWRATQTIDDLRAWAASAPDRDQFARRSAHYNHSAKGGRRDALLGIARSDPRVVVAVDDLDQHPMLLACRNGTVDLASGELKQADPRHLLSHGVDQEYDPDAWSPSWQAFVDTTFGHDADLAGFVQRLLGYCLTGVVGEHVLPVFHGVGANGKSTLIGVVQDLLGDLAMTAPEGLVIQHSHERHPERIASLRGRRLVVSAELEQKAQLAEQMVKMLTGGDVLSARELYGRRFNFAPTHKVILVSNHRPRVSGTDHAIWRRIRLVPFETVIPPDQQDAGLRKRLVEEHGPAILAWLVQGAVAWATAGLGGAAKVEEATASYRQGEDVFGQFLEEATCRDTDATAGLGDVYKAWCSWCELAGVRAVGRLQDLRGRLEDHGVAIKVAPRASMAIGIELRKGENHG